jgi:hypothetical protein
MNQNNDGAILAGSNGKRLEALSAGALRDFALRDYMLNETAVFETVYTLLGDVAVLLKESRCMPL